MIIAMATPAVMHWGRANQVAGPYGQQGWANAAMHASPTTVLLTAILIASDASSEPRVGGTHRLEPAH
jgi:hypothetical protein